MITVVLRPGLDKVRDNLRLRQCVWRPHLVFGARPLRPADLRARPRLPHRVPQLHHPSVP